MGLERPEPGSSMNEAEMESYRDGFMAHLAQTVPGRKELVVEQARGCTIKMADGHLYLDFISGIAVANIGHSHPKVVAAVQEQMANYAHVNVYGMIWIKFVMLFLLFSRMRLL